MKRKSKLSLILICLLVLIMVVPTFAWYYQEGYLFIKMGNELTAQPECSFKAVYGVRTLGEDTATLLGVIPGNEYGENAIEDSESEFYNQNWLESSAISQSANKTIAELVESDKAVVLDGTIGNVITGGEGEGGGTVVVPNDPTEPSDNDIPFVPQSRKIALNSDEFSINDGESDNRLSLAGCFSSDEDKIIGASVTVTPTDSNNEYDKCAVQSVNYALFYEKTYNADGSKVENPLKTIFANTSFSYLSENEKKTAVSQNNYFLVTRGETYKVTCVIWLDGYCDPKAESGSYSVNVEFSDLANITTSSAVSADKAGNVMLNSVDVVNLIIPPAFYHFGELKTVDSIAEGAFSEKTNLKSVVIPDTVTTIGEEAFFGCKNLSSVEIGNGVTAIGKRAFLSCDSLETAKFANPYGWKVSGENIDVNLQSTSTLVEYLTVTYAQEAWSRM